MKFKLVVLIIAIAIISMGCQNKVIEKPNSEVNSDEIQNNEEINEDKEAKEVVVEVKEYTGQALDILERDGIVEVYKEKDKHSDVIYTMKDLEEIKLLETLPYGWFKVELEDGEIGYVDARYVRTREVPPHDYDEKVDGYAIVFNHEDQNLKIYKDGELIKESIASSGLWDHYTPRGIFQVEKNRRGKWFYTPRFKQGAKYWVGFKSIYLFHSIPFNMDQQIIEEEAEKLGSPASHGCIRLPIEVAKYIYENVPAGARVLIY